jgi:hypothetical protein
LNLLGVENEGHRGQFLGLQITNFLEYNTYGRKFEKS